MAYKITSACVSCGSCADVCPAGAISQGDDQYVIDAAACLDCGSCSDTCPNGAIVPEEESRIHNRPARLGLRAFLSFRSAVRNL